MNIRTSARDCAFATVVMLVVLNGANIALGQERVWQEAATDGSFDISLGAVQAVPDSALSSVEEGQTPLDGSFSLPSWRLEKRRAAFKDTKFEVNLRTFYFDRNQFNGSEAQAWAIGGWVGVKTGYFLDHVAFGTTLYTSQPIYAPSDRSGSLLLLPNQDGYTVLGEFYMDVRIFDGLNVNVGARGYDTPFINRNDTRMTPNTFEAIVLQGRVKLGTSSEDDSTTADGLGPSKDGKEVAVPSPTPTPEVATIKYGLGYFDQIKERNGTHFVSMAIDAG